MTLSPPPLLRALTLLACAACTLLTACGGGDEGGDAAYATSTGNAVPSAATVAQGKTLYNQYCFNCHGSNMGSAKDSSHTLGAIAANQGGMGALSGVIGTAEADAIAGYLAYGL